MKFKLVIVLTLVVAILAGCSGNTETDTTTENATDSGGAVVEMKEIPSAEGPLALTSAGQSADVKMIEALISKAEVEYTIDTVMTADGLGDAKTLILAIGGSSKGLGAAGINADDEIARVDALITAAKEKGITIIGMHVGGEGRRGELSDKFINATLDSVDYLIYVEGGNADGLLSDTTSANGIPSESVESIAASLAALQNVLK